MDTTLRTSSMESRLERLQKHQKEAMKISETESYEKEAIFEIHNIGRRLVSQGKTYIYKL